MCMYAACIFLAVHQYENETEIYMNKSSQDTIQFDSRFDDKYWHLWSSGYDVSLTR